MQGTVALLIIQKYLSEISMKILPTYESELSNTIWFKHSHVYFICNELVKCESKIDFNHWIAIKAVVKIERNQLTISKYQ